MWETIHSFAKVTACRMGREMAAMQNLQNVKQHGGCENL
jgi:hypothetical protein